MKNRRPPDWLLDQLTLNHLFVATIIIIPGLILLLGWPDKPQLESATVQKEISGVHSQEPIQPIPLSVEVNPRKVALGETLFNDKKLSGNGTVSCATCHDLSKGGADGLKFSTGMGGEVGPINAPTVFNAQFNFRQFWDGRAADLEEQAAGPITNPGEMDGDWARIIAYLNQNEKYRQDFLEIYEQEPEQTLVQNAIAEFERSLYTPNSRFDRYLMGDTGAITAEELQGYQLFKKNGCVSCHQGQGVGGNMYQSFGVLGNYFKDRKAPITKADLGRYNITGKEADKHIFKVPSLRNVALTAPYFHDGSAKTLADAVRVMARYQLGRTLPEQEVQLIVSFLETLTGEYKGKPL